MRLPEYLSPTSIKMFFTDREMFYQQYLSDNKIKRSEQTLPMAIGSAFDAYCKSYLYSKFYGPDEAEKNGYALGSLFASQVEEYNRDWAWKEGDFLFRRYASEGCLADLLLEMDKAVGPPRFEFSIKGEVQGVPLLGKPDLFFLSSEGARVIYDWKVNGYCSKSLKSPVPGYLSLRDNGKNKRHKDCFVLKVNGIDVNVAAKLEELDKDWAAQLTIYAWLLGEEVGSNFITGIEQICGPKERLRFASHRVCVSQEYQDTLINDIGEMWDIIISGWIFRDLTEEESLKRCEMLDQEDEFDWLD